MSSTRSSSRIVLIAASILLIAAGQAGASVVLFSNLGPGDSYDMGTGGTLGGFSWPNTAIGNVFSFAGPQSYALDSVELPAGWVTGPNLLTVSVMTDVAGLPGVVLESFLFTDQMGSFGNANPLLVGASVTHPLLTPGTNYWLVASAPDPTWAAWNKTLPMLIGPSASSVNGGPWSPEIDSLEAFRINGTTTAIPAPGALLLGVVGLGCLRGLRRRRAA